mmetsp:Transcript_62000/g.113757  ORF Transcript_62000/g.113757 Transcript_62000/m.113757 type:complete len:628 (-) Transcript_62000:257-2140(-)
MAMIALLVTFVLGSVAQPLPAGLSDFFVKQSWSQEADFNRRVVVSVSGSGGPVIIALHGKGGRGMTWSSFESANINGGNYVFFAPDGYQRSWNVVQQSDAPDVAFIEAIVDKAAASSNCDLSLGVTIMGSSNGCAMLHRLLIESSRPELTRFACFAALLNTNNYNAQEGKFFAKNDVSGSFSEALPLASGRTLWSFHGTRDTNVPIEGGPRRGITLHSARTTTAAWGTYYGSTANATSVQEGFFTKYSYLDDRVVLYEMQGSGHGIWRSRQAMMKVKQLVEDPRWAMSSTSTSSTTSTIAAVMTTAVQITSTSSSTAPSPGPTTPAPTEVPAGIISGDTVFLRTRSGNGNHVDIEGVAVRARWQSHGNWQAMTIQKDSRTAVHSGDIIYLKTHTGKHLDVLNGVVQARFDDRGAWQAMTIERRYGQTGPISTGDLVCLKAHDGKYLDVEDDVVRARWSDCAGWQSLRIEKEAIGAIFSGASIHLLAHTANRIEVEGSSVGARWSEAGAWQTFTIENYGGRAIFSGDAVFLKAHTQKLVHVQGTRVLAKWERYGPRQTFIMEKKDGDGPVMPGDTIFIRAHTGRYVEVEGLAVKASWWEKGHWQALTIEKAASSSRRLTDASHTTLVV